jgi:hypothetical protein
MRNPAKPLVHYVDMASPPKPGFRAKVLLGREWYVTSYVLRVWPTSNGPGIETRNTNYVPFGNTEPRALATEVKDKVLALSHQKLGVANE